MENKLNLDEAALSFIAETPQAQELLRFLSPDRKTLLVRTNLGENRFRVRVLNLDQLDQFGCGKFIDEMEDREGETNLGQTLNTMTELGILDEAIPARGGFKYTLSGEQKYVETHPDDGYIDFEPDNELRKELSELIR